ncbi:MAG: AAA family ATPase [Syntrophobacteraceae bacterium]|nr:AAA family ATPase [Desulfobacteraceae bacterium]
MVTPEKRSEFLDFYKEFLQEFPYSSEGQRNQCLFHDSKTQAQVNFRLITEADARHEDITDLVLRKLLPYDANDANLSDGTWTSHAPIAANYNQLRRKYEGGAWVSPTEWPAIATAIWEFVKSCINNPSTLEQACKEFRNATKGFQSGTLSPILAALKPEYFILINSKPLKVINYFTGSTIKADLASYPKANEIGRKLIKELTADLSVPGAPSLSAADLFDMFCHWLVAVRKFEFPRKVDTPSDGDDPQKIPAIFKDWNDANLALDFLKDAFVRLGVDGPADPRLSVTLPKTWKDRLLRVNFGNWMVIDLRRDATSKRMQVNLALLKDSIPENLCDRIQGDAFKQKDGDPDVCIVETSMSDDWKMSSELREAYEKSFSYIAERFKDWQGTPYSFAHRASLLAAVFDLNKRNKLFHGVGLTSENGEGHVVDHEYSLQSFTEETGIDADVVTRWIRALERKGQAIIYGPPGTGKTFVAQRLAKIVIGNDGGFRDLVQFHPAYAYEDFMQGIRPDTAPNGALCYSLRPGRFLEFCQKAAKTSGRSVLIIDEINRANLARVFGELMYLLEYRDEEVPLAGSNRFSIPRNVIIIGTMNTADRSIALVDHALRRRFAFLPLRPDYNTLAQYHQRNKTDCPTEGLIQLLKELNSAINDFHYEIGISFFLRLDLQKHIEDIWRMEIEPYLEEYFFDQREMVTRYRWDSIKQRIGL